MYPYRLTLAIWSQTSLGKLTRSAVVGWPLLHQTLPSSSCCCCSTLSLLSNPPLYHPWGEYSVEWMAPDRGLKGWNVSLALQGSDPPEHWGTAQSLLINHCQACPGPGPNNSTVQPLFLALYPIHLKDSDMSLFHTTHTSWIWWACFVQSLHH